MIEEKVDRRKKVVRRNVEWTQYKLVLFHVGEVPKAYVEAGFYNTTYSEGVFQKS